MPFFVDADLTSTPALFAAVESVRSRLGPIAVLMNNAANDQRYSIAETTPESWAQGFIVDGGWA